MSRLKKNPSGARSMWPIRPCLCKSLTFNQMYAASDQGIPALTQLPPKNTDRICEARFAFLTHPLAAFLFPTFLGNRLLSLFGMPQFRCSDSFLPSLRPTVCHLAAMVRFRGNSTRHGELTVVSLVCFSPVTCSLTVLPVAGGSWRLRGMPLCFPLLDHCKIYGAG